MKNIFYLLQKQFYEDRKGLIIYAAVIFGILLLPSLARASANSIPNSMIDPAYKNLFRNFLFLGGFIMTSLSFSETMHSKVKQHTWLMLPVHAHEKLITHIIYFGIIYPIVLMLFFFLSSIIIEGINTLSFGRHALIFNILDPVNWKMVLHYLVLQSIFLLGAAYFKSTHFIKTVLVIMAGVIVLSLFTLLSFRIVYGPYFRQSVVFSIKTQMFNFFSITSDPYLNQTSLLISPANEPYLRFIATACKIIYWAFLAPFCWLITDLRIREVEATDAV